MQDVRIPVSLTIFSFVSLFLFPRTSVADGDWYLGHFYEKLKEPYAVHQGLYGGEFSRVHDSSYYPRRGIDPRDRLYGGRDYYRNDYRSGYYGNGWGHRPWHRRKYGHGGWRHSPRYGYDRDNYYRRHRSPW